MQICCKRGSYVHYDTAGNAVCDSFCSTDNIYLAQYCCDGLTAGCSNTYSATTCNPSYLVQNSCSACPGFCSSNSQLCTNSFSLTSCNQQCRSNEVYFPNTGCLQCDPSCNQCTSPLSSSSCSSCAVGYTFINNVCQACTISCLTCDQSTDTCTSCNRTNNYTLYNGKCYGICSNSGYYFDTVNLICKTCSLSCI